MKIPGTYTATGYQTSSSNSTMEGGPMNGIRIAEHLAAEHERLNGDREPELHVRAREIAQFLGIPEGDAIARLSLGFGYQHQRVNDDFRRVNPQTDEELLDWYRTTPEYIWELTAYHLDPGFNYAGMCAGIAERLKNEGVKRVLCLGDGIGDLTLSLCAVGIEGVYHDLAGSQTYKYAVYRQRLAVGGYDYPLTFSEDDDDPIESVVTFDWNPSVLHNSCYRSSFEAIVSLDFLEHVTDVPAWARAIYAALRPGGLFCAQNAFDCGSGPQGAIPCHLAINDKYAHAAPHTEGMALWDWLLIREIGFEQVGSNWYRRPV
jgi:SAM-dependent methyltransferase